MSDTARERAIAVEAFRKGAMLGLGYKPWDDADDFFTLIAIEYANGQPIPEPIKRTTSPEPPSVEEADEFDDDTEAECLVCGDWHPTGVMEDFLCPMCGEEEAEAELAALSPDPKEPNHGPR